MKLAVSLALCALCMSGECFSKKGVENTPEQENPPLSSTTTTIEEETVHCESIPILSSYFHKNEFRLTGDFLYWQANEDGLHYSSGGDATFDSTGNLISITQNIDDLNFKWHPGFRLGIGTFIKAWDGWDLYLNWTHIKGSGSGSTFSDLQQGPNGAGEFAHPLIALWGLTEIFSPIQLTEASSHWSLDYDTVDLELGREFWLGQAFSIRPNVGFRGAFIDQNSKTSYLSLVMSGSSAVAPQNYTADNDFNAFGLRCGSNLNWHFAKNWNILSQISTSLLYGNFDVKGVVNAIQNQMQNNNKPLEILLTRNYWRNRLEFEAGIGIQWNRFFHKGKRHVSLSALYEITEWLQMNEFILVEHISSMSTTALQTLEPRGGTLGLQGVTLKADFHF